MTRTTTDASAPRKGRPATDLTTGPIAVSLLIFSLPVLGGNALQSLNGSVNQFWVSHSLGVTAVTAIGNANIVMMLMLGGVFGVSMAANILVAQKFGARDPDGVKEVMGTASSFFAALAILVAVAGYGLTPTILHTMGTPQNSVAEAETYLRIVFITMPFLYFFTFLQMVQRGVGDSRTPFYFMLLAVALDVGLNPLLIRGVGPFPKLGIAGSAISTLIGQGVSLGLLVAFLYRRGSPLLLRWNELHLLRPDPALVRALLTRGLPMGLQMLVLSGSAIVMIGFVNRYGAVTAAAFTAASQVWAYVQMPAMALGATVSSMAAQNIGAGLWPRVDRIAGAGVGLGLAATIAAAAVIYLLGDASVRLFLPVGSAALPIARHINDVVLWSFVLFSITFALSGVVRATGAVWAPLMILVISMFALRIPFAAVLTSRLGAEAIWWSFPLGVITSSVLNILYYRFGGWRNARLIVTPRHAAQAGDGGAAAPAVAPPAGQLTHPTEVLDSASADAAS